MKIIYINMRFLAHKITGVQRFSYEICLAIDKLLSEASINSKNVKFIGLMPNISIHSSYTEKFKNIELRKVGIFKFAYLWEQFDLFCHSRGGYLINLTSLGPVFKKNQCVCFHDIAVYSFPNIFKPTIQVFYKSIFKKLIKNSKDIFAVSSFSRNELVKYLYINESRISLIYNGIDHLLDIKFNDQIFEKYSLTKSQYILAVGSNAEHKNFNRLISVFRNGHFKLPLVIAGSRKNKVFLSEDNHISDNQIIFLDYVDDSSLASLYSNALFFIFPSLYEGFGIPPLEAMYYNCPVLASNAASIPEICGEAALYFNPYSEEDMHDKINILLENKSKRSELIKYGRKNITNRIEHLNWKNSAIILLKKINVI